jgi:hypothetical protein
MPLPHRRGAGARPVSWRPGNACVRVGAAVSSLENNFTKAPECIPVFNSPFV